MESFEPKHISNLAKQDSNCTSIDCCLINIHFHTTNIITPRQEKLLVQSLDPK